MARRLITNMMSPPGTNIGHCTGCLTRRCKLPIPQRRTICVCVDDYGLHAGINQAALNLVRENRISAVSCLVDGPAWPSGWNALKPMLPRWK